MVRARGKRVGAGVAVSAICILSTRAFPATIIWDGLDGTDNVHWNIAGNWNPDGVPTPGADDLRFPTTTGNRSTNNDFPANSQFNGIDFPAAAYTLAGNAINLAGNVTQSATGTGDNIISLNTALQQNTTYTVSSTLRLRPDGDISGSYSLTKEGTGTMRLIAPGVKKTYAGDTIINAGTVDLQGDFLPNGAGKGNVVVNSGATLQNANASFTINGLNGAGTVTKTGTNTRTMTLGDGNASGNFTGVINQTGTSFAITKIGTGTQQMGNSNHGAATTISAGTYLVNGVHTGAAANYVVASGATLGGIGTINLTTGNVTVNGTLAPGDSPGTLDIDNAIVFGANAAYTVEVGGATPGDGYGFYDQVKMTDAAASITVGANVTLNAAVTDGFSPSGSDAAYILTRADAGVFGTPFAGAAEGATINLTSGGTAQITYVANWTGTHAGSSLTGGNDVALYNFQVPEPGSLAMLSLGALAAGVRRRRR